MTTKTLSFKTLPNLAITEGATTPNAGSAGVWAWSTSLSKPVFWNGTTWSAGSSGGVAPLTATGIATLDFGAFPGSNEAQVSVTGQTQISTSSKTQVKVSGDSTSGNHSPSDHQYAALFLGLTQSTPVAGTGFTIYARSTQKLQGTFTLRWVWTD